MTRPAQTVLPADHVHDQVSAVARRCPERAAIVAGEVEVSFGELDRLSDALRDRLFQAGVAPRSVVGLLLGRTVEQVVALLAVLKAGCAYLPLDARYPAERLRYMVEHAGAVSVLTGPGSTGREPWLGALPVVPVSLPALAGADEAGRDPVRTHPSDLAYVMYTSGSTGRPKAVEVTHGNVAALIRGLAATVWRDLGHCRVAWNASVSFDASVQQWTRLCRGDTLVLLDEAARTDPVALVDCLVRHRVTDLDVVPSQLRELAAPIAVAGLRPRLLVGGEPVPPALWDELSCLARGGALRAWNMYGPTECTVDSTTAEITGGSPHIGRPLPEVRCYVLDPALAPVGAGETGELFIAGPNLARGYRGLPGQTAAAFVPDVIAGDGGRMYRTGDLVRLLADGRLEFLRRRDRQVKVRGHRVELGEIEAALTGLRGVRAAAATLRADLPAGPGIAAYVVLAAGATLPDVRRRLRDALPSHLVPAALVQLDRLPIGVTGKVDHDALPAPEPTGSDAAPGQPATDSVEAELVKIWGEVLRGARIDASGNFFDLGGDSIAVARVLNRCRERLGVRVPAKSLFDHPVLRDFAAILRSRLAGAGQPAAPTSSEQSTKEWTS